MSKFRKQSSSSFGDWVMGKVQTQTVDGKIKRVRFIPFDEDGNENEKNATEFSPKNVPENIFMGKHAVQLSEDGKTITNFRPYSGQFTAKFVRFSGKKDEPPAPKSYTSQKNGSTYMRFFPMFEITEGQYKGCQASYPLYYNFIENEDGYTDLKGGGKETEKIEEFLDYTIGQFDPPKFSDNLLPLFQKMALRADKTVSLVFKKGYVVTLLEVDQPSKHKASSKKEEDEPPWKETPDKE